MGISICEFRITMETLEAERLNDCVGSRYNLLVPQFEINGTHFFHSGSYYIVHQGNYISDDIMNRAMAELGETFPGGDNFWWGEVHSVVGLLTLGTMLRGDYSKELVKNLTNKVYKTILNFDLIRSNMKSTFALASPSGKIQELHDLLKKYDDIVNPYGSGKYTFKEPIECLDKVNISIDACDNKLPNAWANLGLKASSSNAHYNVSEGGWCYRSVVFLPKKGDIFIRHYFNNGNEQRPEDEVVSLTYHTQWRNIPRYLYLQISLKTGLSWKEDESKTINVTDEQIDFMIKNLKISIENLKKDIVDVLICN